jgi:ABC-type glutathione transport system ATPase component
MNEAVFEANWSSEELIKTHKEIISEKYKGKGRAIISLDWTQAHHERGANIYAVTKAYDYVKRRESLFQTVVTAVISNRERVDGLDIVVQQPSKEKEKLAYLAQTTQQTYKEMEKVQERMLELMHFHKHKLEYKKKTEIVLEMVKELEVSKQFPNANYISY